MMIRYATMFLVPLVLAVMSQTAGGKSYFVSPQGRDTNPGTIDQPFATLGRAQQAVRQDRGREPATVNLREGVYYLPETLVFTAEDSGTKASPVIYQAYEQEKVVISGGVRLTDLKWTPYKDGIMQANVPAGFTTDQLFVNGQRQPLARYPNFDPNVRHFNGYAADAISPQRAARWKDPRGGFIHAMHAAEWGGMHYVITGKGPDNRITYEGGWQNNRPSGMHRQYRMVENIFEELDAPGEWFLDAKAGILYFYPPAGLDLSSATIEAVRLRHVIEFRGTAQAPIRFITIKGVTIRHAARTFMENREPLVRSDWTTYRGGAVFYTGTEDCALEDCFIDQVGGNAVFVNNYNRRLAVRGCHIADAGANGVAFVGDRDSARVPRDWNDRSQNIANLDRTPGPKIDNYPADCIVDDCLIYRSGRVEKQTAPVQIELAQSITVRHCSLYDVPRAGINIGDGCWGGHVIEFCDIFDTVKETGDHGSFNSWGRDRYWGLDGLNLNDDRIWEKEKDLVRLDAVKPVTLRNNRWRCDHGWDIDLDDGSTAYELRNNLCLNGGIKNREGFYRVVENNIMVNNGFHPHVWYKHSQDVVRRNIMWTDHYLPAGGMPSTPWGKEMDYNLVHREGAADAKPAVKLAQQSRRDEHSIIADAMFVDAAHGDFRVKDGSPALALGFVNFPMDQFGVQKPLLKAIARMPQMPKLMPPPADGDRPPAQVRGQLWQATTRDISGLGDRSAYGLPDESGILLLDVPAGSAAAKFGLQKDDVIVGCNGKPVRTIKDLQDQQKDAAGKKLALAVMRKQKQVTIEIPAGPQAQSPAAATFKADWNSLKAHKDPEWFRDAKFGIYTHWGPVTVGCEDAPQGGEWYGREMYLKDNPIFEWHRKTFGDQNQVGYKDIVPRFTATKFDPEKWADLFARAGARFAGPVAVHHDNFAMWDSAIAPWNAMKMGPKRDVVGELARAYRARGMKVLTTFHHGFAWRYFEPAFNFDAADGRNLLLYTEPHGLKDPPSRRFQEQWLAMAMEVVRKYEPDIIWFDFELRQVITPEYQQRMFAEYYNWAAAHGRESAVAHKFREIHQYTGILDFERGREDRLVPYPWLTDTALGPWFNRNADKYRSTENLIHVLVDIVSKNGCLLLNVGPNADGSIPQRAEKMLLEIGAWLKINGEAIYGTRPWLVYGEGPTHSTGGGFSEGKDRPFTAQDIRFTTKGNALYAIALGRPQRQFTIHSIRVDGAGPESRVELLGHGIVSHRLNSEKQLVISLPAQCPGEHAFAFKLTGFKTSLHPSARFDQGDAIRLEPAKATCEGELKLQVSESRPNIGFWDNSADRLHWLVQVKTAGRYMVRVELSSAYGPSALKLTVAGQSRTADVPQTDSWFKPQFISFEEIQLDKPGVFHLVLAPCSAQTWRAVNVYQVQLARKD